MVLELGNEADRRRRPGRQLNRSLEPELAFLSEADVAELRLRQVMVLLDLYVAALEGWLRDEAAEGGTT